MHPVILIAATQLFAQKGSEQPTMDEAAAAAAGVQKGNALRILRREVSVGRCSDRQAIARVPVLRLADDTLPLRGQLVDVGLQLQELAAHSATVSLILGFVGEATVCETGDLWLECLLLAADSTG